MLFVIDDVAKFMRDSFEALFEKLVNLILESTGGTEK